MVSVSSLYSVLANDYLALATFAVGVIAVINGLKNYTSPIFARRVYSAPEALALTTPLTGRLFGTWTIFSGIVRLYGAFHLTNRELYHMIMASYLVVFVHMILEMMSYRTMKKSEFGSLSPIVVSAVGFGAMMWYYGEYFQVM
eukprot:TRINITY_DN29608_c0_g1_i1.p1 TRINITY_DN29608_c0_g1~~TRINITY_DN29608_c0_g1_i1.p1  ORF type:complete len:150 (-),score=3.38 TRINITY_DN29608_c0_g1_i1:36-464(-)